jgi:protein O-mannosyl-transferase
LGKLQLTRKSVQITCIVLLGLLIYAITLNAPFYFDDYVQVINTPAKSFSYFLHPESARSFKGYGGFVSRYFGYLTFALNYRIHGLNVTGYHLVNIGIHLLASLLVFWLVTLTFQTPFFRNGRDPEKFTQRAGFIAFLAALLFVVHPLQTQAVTYISQRFASLAAMLYLLSLTSYIRARLTWREPGRSPAAAIAWLAVALAAALLAVKTKETAFTLPLTVVLYELLFFTGNLRKKLLALSLFSLASLAALLLSRLSGGSFGEIIARLDQATRLQTDMSRWDYLATQCRVLVTYLRLLVLPVGQRLDYDYPVSSSFLDSQVFLSLALLTVLFAGALYLLRRSGRRSAADDDATPILRLVAFGIFWFFVTLSIESSIIPIVDVIFEHRMYLPSAGLFMALAAAVSIAGGTGGAIPGWPRTQVLLGTAGVILVLAGTTVARNQLWRDEVAFWQDNAGKTPRNPRVFLNLGRAMERQGDLQGAEKAYRTASLLDPEQTDSLVNLGLIYIQWNRLPDALAQFKAALAKDQNLAEAHNNMGKVYGMMGQLDEALKEFLQTVQLKPNLAEPYSNLGYLYSLRKQYPEALQAFEKCLALDPDYELAYLNRGKALLATGRRGEAAADFRRALELNPADSEAAAYLQQAGQGR